MAELGFLGDIVTTLLTIPFAWGHLISIGVLDSVGFLYFGPGFNFFVLRIADCLQVASYRIKWYEYYITKACQEKPSQYIKNGTPRNNISSLEDKSTGTL